MKLKFCSVALLFFASTMVFGNNQWQRMNHRLPAAANPLNRASKSCHGSDTVQCRALEAHILAVTVRLKIEVLAPQAGGGYEVVDRSNGHATVMAGRFLVTHNHFTLSLENLNDGHLRRLSAYGADGRVIIQDAPFHLFKVYVAQPQTVVLDFGRYGRQGALAYAGFRSAQFASRQQLRLQAGAEVAQVNWDGRATVVQWVRVTGTRLEHDSPVVELDNYAEQGSSGGGVFYNGYHVGNVWFSGVEMQAANGQMLRQYSVSALNDAVLLTLAETHTGRSLAAVGPSHQAGALLPEMQSTNIDAR